MSSGGLASDSLAAVTDFAQEVEEESVDDDDRWLNDSHPLVMFAKSALESISSKHLGKRIVGLTHASKERILSSRMDLEEDKRAPALQTLLYWFEQLCDLVKDAGYRDEGIDESREFFTEAFPSWLESIEDWALEVKDDDLRRACEEASKAYGPIADDIVRESDD